MNKLKTYSDSFKLKFEKFLTGCDAVEEMELWDLSENGEMDVFYSSELTSIIIRLITADGNVSQKEVDYLNEFFGLDYSTEELQTIYDDCEEGIISLFDTGVKNGLVILRSINEKLASAYTELIINACDIIIASDEIIENIETELVYQLKQRIV